MEIWHDHIINKYLPLKSEIKSRGWEVDIYAIEVGGREYCARYLLCSLWNPGFSNIQAKKTLENCEQTVNEILFLYLTGQRKCGLAICLCLILHLTILIL